MFHLFTSTNSWYTFCCFILGWTVRPQQEIIRASFHLFQTAPFITIHSQTLLSVNVTASVNINSDSGLKEFTCSGCSMSGPGAVWKWLWFSYLIKVTWVPIINQSIAFLVPFWFWLSSFTVFWSWSQSLILLWMDLFKSWFWSQSQSWFWFNSGFLSRATMSGWT